MPSDTAEKAAILGKRKVVPLKNSRYVYLIIVILVHLIASIGTFASLGILTLQPAEHLHIDSTIAKGIFVLAFVFSACALAEKFVSRWRLETRELGLNKHLEEKEAELAQKERELRQTQEDGRTMEEKLGEMEQVVKRVEEKNERIQNDCDEKIRAREKHLEFAIPYQKATEAVLTGIAKTNQIARDSQANRRQGRESLDFFLTKFTEALRLIKPYHYSVCLELAYEEDGEVYVQTICHDDKGLMPERRFKQEKRHTRMITKDSAHTAILKKIDNNIEVNFYLANSLLKLSDYHDPLFSVYGNDYYTNKGFPPKMSEKEKRENWPLPYKSILVLPILPVRNKELLGEEDLKYLGFLSIRAKEENAFDKDF
ncbi:MAG: hypothetical protein AAFV25_13465, partial [Bacteroidota bacterium]